jgi:secreted PhoX family phosphatase
MTLSRRKFFSIAGATAVGTLAVSPLEGLLARAAFGQTTPTTTGYGPLITVPGAPVALPAGFQYRVIARAGETMSDGFPMPAAHDGMAAFPGPRGTTILICNHELSGTGTNGAVRVPSNLSYDPACRGGTTTMVVNSDRQLVRRFASLGGTIRNCAGGVTPWGSWITCEEDLSIPGSGRVQYHGYNFEVPANATGPVEAVPLKAMGRFNHEAVAVDPVTGIVYQTEDRGDSLFYRFIPNVPGKLAEGGRLQALKIGNTSSVNTAAGFSTGQTWTVNWVDISDPDPITDTVRFEGQSSGAARFARGEGIWYDGKGSFYFCCTNGGSVNTSGNPNGFGQVFRYTPATETLELFVQSSSTATLKAPDNIVVAPFGDLILCEDGAAPVFLRGVTPDGKLYDLARNTLNNSEFAGACFSPDGQTMFVNIYSGVTLAIWGPWETRI